MIQTNTLAHVAIETNNLAACEQFYCQILGFQKQFNFLRQGKPIGFYIRITSNCFLEIFFSEDSYSDSSRLTHFCLETNDIEYAHNHLKKHHIEVSEINKACDNTLQFWFKDPNGINLEYHQYTEKSSQITGQDIEVNW